MFKTIRRVLDLLASKDAELSAERAARAFLAQRLAEQKLEHAAEIAEIRRQLAISQANFEWLSASHNTLTMERSQLLTARTGVSMPAPQIVTEVPEMGLPRTDERPIAYDGRRPPWDEGGTAVGGGMFGDIGETAARAQGIEGPVYGPNLTAL